MQLLPSSGHLEEARIADYLELIVKRSYDSLTAVRGRCRRSGHRGRLTQFSLKRPIGSQCADRRLLRIPGMGVHGSWQTGHPHPEAQRYHQTRSPLDISAGG